MSENWMPKASGIVNSVLAAGFRWDERERDETPPIAPLNDLIRTAAAKRALEELELIHAPVEMRRYCQCTTCDRIDALKAEIGGEDA